MRRAPFLAEMVRIISETGAMAPKIGCLCFAGVAPATWFPATGFPGPSHPAGAAGHTR